MNDLIKNVEAKFDKQFTDQWWAATQGHNDNRNELLKAFIRQAIQSAVTERENEIISELKSMKATFEDGICFGDHQGCDASCLYAHNITIDQVIGHIKALV